MPDNTTDKQQSTFLSRRFGGVVFNGPPPRATWLTEEWISNDAQTGIAFSIDDRFLGSTSVDWSDVGGRPSDSQTEAVNWALLTLVAQFCLPESIVTERGLEPPSPALRPLLQMLYDIRAFCDESDYKAVPISAHSPMSAEHHHRHGSLDDSRALVVMSGGYDSTLAAIAMKEAGFEVTGLHVRCNRHAEASEQEAARLIADKLGIPITTIRLAFPDQERIGRYYSRSFGDYPFYNSIPHGRDLPLSVIAGIVACRLGCQHVVFGHEKESRHKVIKHSGRSIFRHDVESEYGRQLTERYLQDTINPALRFWSPIAGASLYHIRKTMLTRFTEISKSVRSCFWGYQCEKCLKCLSTYVMQRHLGVQAHSFHGNAFADPDDDDMRLFAQPDGPSEHLGYGAQMHYAMTRLLQEGFAKEEDYWLEVYRRSGLDQVLAHWETIERICLEIVPEPTVPPNVHNVLEALR